MSEEATGLSPKELAFVRQYVSHGGVNATNAAIAAGYSARKGRNSAGVQANRLLRRQKVLQEIKLETERSLRAGVALGATVLVDLAKGGKSESVRLQAATALLDRGGMQLKALSEHRIELVDKRSDAELLARIETLSRELGVGARVIEAREIEALPELRAIEAAPPVEMHTALPEQLITDDDAIAAGGSLFD